MYIVVGKEVSVINGSLLNFESLNKSYLILFQERNDPSKVYPLLIEIIDVPEPSDFKLEKTTDNGCCNDVRRLLWMVPVSSALEFILIMLGITILFCCVPKKGKQTIVKPFGK
ncbi:uncharacterized protein LOC134249172 [Saccostrea cucullata]|uniref:uncharacterized protein LOC134249172 n=1 Tax=Saccostrea cuccullata TaxID=36930 RepID=UPI002ED2FA3E